MRRDEDGYCAECGAETCDHAEEEVKALREERDRLKSLVHADEFWENQCSRLTSCLSVIHGAALGDVGKVSLEYQTEALFAVYGLRQERDDWKARAEAAERRLTDRAHDCAAVEERAEQLLRTNERVAVATVAEERLDRLRAKVREYVAALDRRYEIDPMDPFLENEETLAASGALDDAEAALREECK